MTLPGSIRITDVGPRDGLQNESQVVSTESKVLLVDRLQRAGVAEVEVSGFVRPDRVPQLADASGVFDCIERVEGVLRSALVPNERGWEAAQAAGVDKIAVFASASESFSRGNINCSIAESLDRFVPVVQASSAASIPVRAYISCAVACPHEGPVDPAAVVTLVSSLLELGVDEIDLGDTIGMATPEDIERLLETCSSVVAPGDLTLHLHDTGGGALACCLHAMHLGVRSFDTSCGGLGGCPFAPGASGNLATEDLVRCCQLLGVETGVSLEAIHEAATGIEAELGRAPASITGRAMAAQS